MFQSLIIPPEVLEVDDRCELDLTCTNEPYALIITEKDSFFVCREHHAKMNAIEHLMAFLED